VRPFFEQYRLRFECTGCGRCCITGNGYHVFLTSGEATRIRNYLGLSNGWFRRRYLDRTGEGDLVLTTGDDAACIFLQGDNRCRVYPVRPVQCRTYPFWPEVVSSRAAWQREARRCEGINRGPWISTTTIRRKLRDSS